MTEFHLAYGDGSNHQVSVDELARLVTEQGNPGDLQNVVLALVEVPSPRLQQRVLPVGTPGLGSLAKRGAAEAMAYLPSCDPALLLIDPARRSWSSRCWRMFGGLTGPN